MGRPALSHGSNFFALVVGIWCKIVCVCGGGGGGEWWCGGGSACCFAEKLTRFKAYEYHPCGLSPIQLKCFSNFDKKFADVLESRGQRSQVSLANLWSIVRPPDAGPSRDPLSIIMKLVSIAYPTVAGHLPCESIVTSTRGINLCLLISSTSPRQRRAIALLFC